MYRFPSLKHSNWLFFHEQYDGVTGKMFWWLMKKIIFWLWAGWVASYLQRSLSAQVNGGPDATPNLWKQLFSAVRASGGYPGNEILHRQSFIFLCNPTMLPKAFLHSIFQAIDGESLFNKFVGKYFYSLFEIICFVTYPGISNYLWWINRRKIPFVELLGRS